jgi:hypothetical protein
MSKLEAPVNPNYAATVVRVNHINVLPNCDNVVGVPFFGMQAIVGKDVQVGDIGILFPAESQLSDEYTRKNGLYRHSDKNENETQAGYIEDSRRVKALKFRGHQSDALFMPIESLDYVTKNKTMREGLALEVGDVFDKLMGQEICCKYLVKQPGVLRVDKNASKKFVRVESKFMPEHYDTDNYWRNEYVIPENADIVVTQKLHGTSIRIGNTIVKRRLGWLDKLSRRLGVRVAETEYDHIYGSRKAIRDPNNPAQAHFYEAVDGLDLWTATGKELDDRVPENFILYGELVGFTKNGNPIQKDYTYANKPGESTLYIYRVAVITNQGRIVDLSWDQLKKFCDEIGLKHVPQLWRGKKKDFDVNLFTDSRFTDAGFVNAVPLSNGKLVDEGVVVRTDVGLAPYFLKAKSPIFLTHESKMLDEEAVDLEAENS